MVRIRFDLLVAALVVALIVGSIAGHNAGVRAGAPLGGDPMAGTAAYGTILKLDGVAVAEVTSVTGPGMSRDVPDVSTHDSPVAWREAIGNLKDPGEIAVEGEYLKGQMATLRAALDTDVPKTIQIEFPQGAGAWTFSGFLTALEGGHNVEEANSFSATIKLTTPQEYWHCILAPGVAGTPPPEDPTHWEPVTAASIGNNVGEAVFGFADTSGSWCPGTTSDIRGTVFPFPSGAPVRSVTAEGSWPDWPDPATLNDDPMDKVFNIRATFNAGTNRALSVFAYLQLNTGVVPDDIVQAAIYQADGTFVASTSPVTITDGDPPAWYQFSFAGAGPVLVPGENYALVVWGQRPSGLDTGLYGADIASYKRPDGEVWSPVADDYIFCETVYYKP